MKPSWLTKSMESAIDQDTARPGQLRDWAAIRAFMMAGNATFTLVSVKTGTRFTYKVRKADGDELKYFVSLLAGPDNNDDFSYMGMLVQGQKTERWILRRTRASRASETAPSWRAFVFLLDRLEAGGAPCATLEVWHEGRCGRCGRKLTVPSSVEAGIGPECASYL